MAWINDEPQGDPGPLFAGMEDPNTGRVDNILRIHALHPEGLNAHFRLYEAVMSGTVSLRKIDRELIALRVSQLNRCRY